jgi:hypothetical protein
MKPKKTFLDKKNEEYKKQWSKKDPNKARRQDLPARKRTSTSVSKAKGAK